MYRRVAVYVYVYVHAYAYVYVWSVLQSTVGRSGRLARLSRDAQSHVTDSTSGLPLPLPRRSKRKPDCQGGRKEPVHSITESGPGTEGSSPYLICMYVSLMGVCTLTTTKRLKMRTTTIGGW